MMQAHIYLKSDVSPLEAEKNNTYKTKLHDWSGGKSKTQIK